MVRRRVLMHHACIMHRPSSGGERDEEATDSKEGSRKEQSGWVAVDPTGIEEAAGLCKYTCARVFVIILYVAGHSANHPCGGWENDEHCLALVCSLTC